MDTRKILSELRAERDRIDKAIAALEALDTNTAGSPTVATPARRGRRPGTAAGTPGPKRRGGPRRMSAEGRKRISEMMKKRWAERRKKAKAA